MQTIQSVIDTIMSAFMEACGYYPDTPFAEYCVALDYCVDRGGWVLAVWTLFDDWPTDPSECLIPDLFELTPLLHAMAGHGWHLTGCAIGTVAADAGPALYLEFHDGFNQCIHIDWWWGPYPNLRGYTEDPDPDLLDYGGAVWLGDGLDLETTCRDGQAIAIKRDVEAGRIVWNDEHKQWRRGDGTPPAGRRPAGPREQRAIVLREEDTDNP